MYLHHWAAYQLKVQEEDSVPTDLFINSFTMVVYEDFFKVVSEFPVYSSPTKSFQKIPEIFYVPSGIISRFRSSKGGSAEVCTPSPPPILSLTPSSMDQIFSFFSMLVADFFKNNNWTTKLVSALSSKREIVDPPLPWYLLPYKT